MYSCIVFSIFFFYLEKHDMKHGVTLVIALLFVVSGTNYIYILLYVLGIIVCAVLYVLAVVGKEWTNNLLEIMI